VRTGLHGVDPEAAAEDWLLASKEPAVRWLTLTEVIERSPRSAAVRVARAAWAKGPWVVRLLSGQRANGGFGVHPYQKWTGAHWRLVSLVELGMPEGHPRGVSAAGQVLRWLGGESHLVGIRTIRGRVRRCASQEGNALAVCSRLGLAEDPRVAALAASLQEWQWPDGGWNCDKVAAARHSSFYESLAPLWGLVEYHHATGDSAAQSAARRAAGLFLRHRLFRHETNGAVIDPEWLRLHYPLYWHYDVLQGLVLLGRAVGLGDRRLAEALRIVASKRQPDGRWRAEGWYWGLTRARRPKIRASDVDVVNWGRGGPNTMITLNALRVLRGAGRSA